MIFWAPKTSIVGGAMVTDLGRRCLGSGRRKGGAMVGVVERCVWGGRICHRYAMVGVAHVGGWGYGSGRCADGVKGSGKG